MSINLGRLREYYQDAFPVYTLLPMFKQKIAFREFAFHRFNGTKTYMIRRNELFSDPVRFRKVFTDDPPFDVTNGAVYMKVPSLVSKEKMVDNKVVSAELNFDIDIDQYDDLRGCCVGKTICNKCW